MSFTPEEERVQALRWFKGDVQAVAFLESVAAATQIGDDLVDEDMGELKRARLMARLFERLLMLAANPFYARYQAQLAPLIVTGVLEWEVSNEWQRSPHDETRLFGYVRREALEGVIVFVAYLTGGVDWAMTVGREIHEFYHVVHADGETLDTWSNEYGQL